MKTKITKKSFKEQCSAHRYGKHINALYFDWQSYNGFKYGVWAQKVNATKKELYDVMYNWAFNEEEPPWYVHYRYAATDEKRFKVPISLNWS